MVETVLSGAAAVPEVAPAAPAETTSAAPPQGGVSDSGGAAQAAPAADAAPAPAAVAPAASETNWRDEWAGGDKEIRKALDRFTDQAAAMKSYREMTKKISSGELKGPPQPFPEKGTADEQTAWRQANGIPNDAKEYKIELPEGMVLGEADQPGVDRLTAFAHKNNWSPAQLNGVMAAYYNEMDAVRAAREAADTEYKTQSEIALKEEWKGDFKANLNAVHNLLAREGKEFADRFVGGRTADGKLIANDPEMLRFIARLSRQMYPEEAHLPPGSQAKSITTELEQIRAFSRDNPEKYEADKAMQVRELELLDQQIKSKPRAA